MNGHRQVVHVPFVSTLSLGPQKIVSSSGIPTWNHDGKLEGEMVGKNIAYFYLASSSYQQKYFSSVIPLWDIAWKIVCEVVGWRIICEQVAVAL